MTFSSQVFGALAAVSSIKPASERIIALVGAQKMAAYIRAAVENQLARDEKAAKKRR